MNRPFDGTTATSQRIDPTDDINRIDSIEEVGIGMEKTVLSDSKELALHGGQLWQRLGY
jgi:hypothetical protein